MSKLSLHLQYCPPWVPEFVARSGVGWIKWVDPPEQQPAWAAGVKVIGRFYRPDSESNAMIWKGAAGAQEWWNWIRPLCLARPWLHCIEGPNEPQPMSDPAFRARLNEFTIELARLMHGAGLRLVGMNWSVGNSPDTLEKAQQLGPGVQACDYLGLHEYSAPTMQTDQGWLCLRYRKTVSLLESAGYSVPPLIIGECGIDGGVYTTNQPGKGWRTFCNGDFDSCYLPQLAWYSNELDRDNVACATVFTVCSWDWTDFAIEEPQAMSLADWIASDEPVEPPVPEERAKGLYLSKYQEQVTRDVLQALWNDNYRAIGFRVTGPDDPDNPTCTEVDSIFQQWYPVARELGFLTYGFHYLHPALDGQARAFAAAVKGKTFELGLWGDVEDTRLDGNRCKRFFDAADRETGQTVNVYGRKTQLDAWRNPSDGPWQPGRKLWLAAWTYNLDILPVLPETWKATGFEWWQWTNMAYLPATALPDRVCLDAWRGTLKQLLDAYGNEEPEEPEGGDMAIEIVDRNGQPVEGMTWESVCRDYGLSITQADPPEGATAFRLVRLIYDSSAETNWRLYTLDENGAPLPGVLVFLGILPDSGTELDASQAPRLTIDLWGQPEGRPNRALLLSPDSANFTNVDGYIQHSLGSGSNYIPPILGGTGGGSHWAWKSGDNGDYSDVPAGFGMWDNHLMFWPVFQLQTVGEEEPPTPPPPEDDSLARIAAATERIAAALEVLAAREPMAYSAVFLPESI